MHDTILSTPDEAAFDGSARLGAPLPDAPVRRGDRAEGHLIENIGGEFTLLNVKPAEGQGGPFDARFLTLFIASRFGK